MSLGIIALASFFPFIAGWFFPAHKHCHLGRDHIAIAIPSSTQSQNPWHVAKQCATAIEEVVKHKPDTRVVIMPESSFPFALNECPRSYALIVDAVPDDVDLLCGAHFKENGKLYNSFFHINKRLIMERYDKFHLMPITENNDFKTKLCRRLSQSVWQMPNSFGYSDRKKIELLSCSSGFSCIPQICSDLFLGHCKEAMTIENKQVPIVCIVKDSWFTPSYACRFMRLYACFIQQVSAREIIYVGYSDRPV